MTRSRMTLLFIHGSADLYGSDITLLQLVSGLNRERFCSVVVVPYAGPLVSCLERAGAEVVIRPDLPVLRRQHMTAGGMLRLVASSFRSISWLLYCLRRRNVALVHGNTLAVAIAGLAARIAGRPQVWHVHEIITQPRVVAAFLAALTSAVSTVVIANSQATAEHYRRACFASSTPVRVILNGTREFNSQERSKQSLRTLVGAADGDIVFTLIGRVNRWKGHSVFIDAAESIAAESEDARFLVVGDSFSGQEHLSKAVDQRIETSDLLRGRMVRLPHTAEIGSVYAASDVVIVPSTEPEPFGLVAVEAMAAGLPMIASRIGALPEIVEDGRTGLLVEPNSPVSLTTAMRKLADSPSLRASMGRKGKERFENCFRVKRYVQEFDQLYEEVLGG